MLLRQLIETLDKSDNNKQEVDIYDLEGLLNNCFSINTYLDKSKTNTRVTCYWLGKWLCTDTHVGYRVYFLDDKLLALSYQPARKSDETFTFASKEVKQELKDYIVSLIEVDEEEFEDEFYLNLDKDFGVGYRVGFACQLITDYVMYKGQRCRISYPTGIHENGTLYRKLFSSNYSVKGNPVIIELPDNTILNVDMSEVDVCYNIV
jgi:hypothetical protein